MLTVTKLVFLAVSFASTILATSTDRFRNFSPKLVEGHEESLSAGHFPEGAASSENSKMVGESSLSCEDSFNRAYGQPLSYYVYEPSRTITRRPPQDRTYQRAHEFYGQYINNAHFPPHQTNWQSKYWTETFEEIYSKCYHTLELLGYKGSLAQELLSKYGCSFIGDILLLGDVNYDKVVVSELLRRRKEDHEARKYRNDDSNQPSPGQKDV